MAIGTGLAIATGISAIAGIGGAALSSSAQNKAAKTAATAQTENTTANNALARELYGYNTANFTPYMATGQQAMGALNGLLFGNQPQGQPQASYAPAGSSPLYGNQGGGGVTPNAMGGAGGSYQQMGNLGYQNGPNELYGMDGSSFAPQGQPPGGVTTQAPNAGNAWDTFQNSAYYQLPYQEGMNALNQGYAGIGALNSGAAQKASVRFGSDYAGGRLDEWARMLQGQQNLGFGSAQALAGVSNNYGNAVTANNQNAADAISNSALLRGQNQSNLYGSIAGGIGNLAGSFATSFPKGFG